MDSFSRRRYTEDFKKQAVALVKSGKSASQVAKDLELGRSMLYRWIAAASKSEHLDPKADVAEGKEDAGAEMLRLQRENDRLTLENDILKKAAVILGSPPHSKAAK